MELSEWKRVAVNNHFVSYRTAGSNTQVPVVFMHGGTQDGHSWKPFMLKMFVEKGYYCIVLNRLGFGMYSDGLNEWSEKYLDENADDMISFLDTIGISRCFVVSWCDGANVTLISAARRPDLFAGIVASVPHLKVDFGSVSKEDYISVMSGLPEQMKQNKRYWDTLTAQYGSHENAEKAYMRWFNRCIDYDWNKNKDYTWCLPKIECPVFIVLAGKDEFFPDIQYSLDYLLPLLKESSYWIAEDAPHMLHSVSSPQHMQFLHRSIHFLETLKPKSKL